MFPAGWSLTGAVVCRAERGRWRPQADDTRGFDLDGVQVRRLWLWLLVILGGIAPDVAGPLSRYNTASRCQACISAGRRFPQLFSSKA
jgi:hypothetical protein